MYNPGTERSRLEEYSLLVSLAKLESYRPIRVPVSNIMDSVPKGQHLKLTSDLHIQVPTHIHMNIHICVHPHRHICAHKRGERMWLFPHCVGRQESGGGYVRICNNLRTYRSGEMALRQKCVRPIATDTQKTYTEA